MSIRSTLFIFLFLAGFTVGTITNHITISNTRSPASVVKCHYSVGVASGHGSGVDLIRAQADAAKQCVRKNFRALEIRHQSKTNSDFETNLDDPQQSMIFDQCINLRCENRNVAHADEVY